MSEMRSWESEASAYGPNRDAKLGGYRPGEKIDILIARRSTLMHLDAVLGTDPEDSWRLETDPLATAEQRRHRDSWLHPRQIN
jgi:hypothetical protein